MDRNYADIIQVRICTLCQKRGISVNKLAEMSGLKQSTVSSIMQGKSLNPKIMTLHKIAIAFNMTVAEFLDFPEMNDYSFEDETD